MEGYVTRTYRIKGTVPMLMHNGRMANPLDEYAKALKQITPKKNKTDEDYEEMRRLEFLGSLYVDEKGAPGWPGENIEAMLKFAARTQKRGKDVEKALMAEPVVFPLTYDGPKNADKLSMDLRFVDTRKAGVQRSSVMRTRPIFNEWELEFTVHIRLDKLNPEDVDEFVMIAGRDIGLSDYRPKFGRFVLTAIDGKAVNGQG